MPRRPRIRKLEGRDEERERAFYLDGIAALTLDERFQLLFEHHDFAKELMNQIGAAPPRPPAVVKRA